MRTVQKTDETADSGKAKPFNPPADNYELILSYKQSSGYKKDNLFNQLLLLYRNLIIHVIREKCPHVKGDVTQTIEYSAGLMAFIEALNKFDVDRKMQFSTFLQHNIYIHMKRHLMGYYYGVNCFAADIDNNDTPDEYYEADSVKRCSGIDIQDNELPVYRRLDMEDAIDKGLSRYSSQVVFAVKVLSGLSGYGRIGRLQLYKLIGTDCKSELMSALSAMGITLQQNA